MGTESQQSDLSNLKNKNLGVSICSRPWNSNRVSNFLSLLMIKEASKSGRAPEEEARRILGEIEQRAGQEIGKSSLGKGQIPPPMLAGKNLDGATNEDFKGISRMPTVKKNGGLRCKMPLKRISFFGQRTKSSTHSLHF